MTFNAIILTNGLLQDVHGKTAHGLITGKSRYPIVAVIDAVHVGKDAGEAVDGIRRNIPVFASIPEALTQLHPKPSHCIIGIVNHGGYIPDSLLKTLKIAIENKLCIVNGLHESVQDHPQLQPLLQQYQTEVIDIRKPKSFKEMHPWSGKIQQVKTPRIAVLGMDCAIGKRTTTHLLYQMCQQHGIKTEMIYTGQTGWLQGFRYGFIFDSTLNDFVSGELETAVVNCEKEVSPSLMLFEGQSALRNPSGPCGAEFILSGGAKAVILQHVPQQKYFNIGEKVHCPLPSLVNEIELIQHYGAKVLAITLNTQQIVDQTWEEAKRSIHQETGLPVVCPRQEGVEGLLPVIKQYIHDHNGGN